MNDVFFNLNNKMEVDAKKRKAANTIPILVGPMVDTHRHQNFAKKILHIKGKDTWKDSKSLSVEFDTQASNSKGKTSDLDGLDSAKLNMHKSVQVSLSEHVMKLVEKNDMDTLMNSFLELHSFTLLYGQGITSLLKKEIVDQHKAKMANESANLKKKYEADKNSWAKEKKTLEGEIYESLERLKTQKTRCLDSEKKLKKKNEGMGKALANEKKAHEEVEADLFWYQQFILFLAH